MNKFPSVTIGFIAVLFTCSTGCYFSSGVKTVTAKTYASGVGFFAAAERNGQWQVYGPPPQIGESTERPLYRQLNKGASYSLLGAARDYELEDPYPLRRYRVVAIREIGTVAEGDTTTHYYQVEFEPETSNAS